MNAPKRGIAETRSAVLAAALPHAGFDGFTDAMLRKAAEEAGVSPAETHAAFPEGATSLVEAFSAWADVRMAERLKRRDIAKLRVRERIAAAVRARIEAMDAHREAARRAASFLALPSHAARGASLLYRTVDAMWRAAGDRSTDFNFYTKRGILAGVYGATLLHWLGDDSEGHEKTWAFLDARIEDVMDFEKFKADARRVIANLPDPIAILRRLGGDASS